MASVEGMSAAVKPPANEDFITEIFEFIHNDVNSQRPKDEDYNDDDPRESVEDGQPSREGTEEGAVGGAVDANEEAHPGPVQQNIEAVKKIIEECKKQLILLEKKRGELKTA